MNRVLISGVAASVLMWAVPANAVVVGSLGTSGVGYLTLSTAGLSNGVTPVATLLGGTVYSSDQPFADIPAGGVFGNRFLAAGPSSGNNATLTFLTPVSYLSFLWGSPDTYNVLTVNSTTGTQTFSASNLGFSSTSGNQLFSQPVQFNTTGGTLISSVSFSNIPTIDAFETANFTTTAAVPEPASWAMMVGGFGLLGAAMRRRKVAVGFA